MTTTNSDAMILNVEANISSAINITLHKSDNSKVSKKLCVGDMVNLMYIKDRQMESAKGIVKTIYSSATRSFTSSQSEYKITIDCSTVNNSDLREIIVNNIRGFIEEPIPVNPDIASIETAKSLIPKVLTVKIDSNDLTYDQKLKCITDKVSDILLNAQLSTKTLFFDVDTLKCRLIVSKNNVLDYIDFTVTFELPITKGVN